MLPFPSKCLFFLVFLAATSCAPVQQISLNTSNIPLDKVFSYRQTSTTTTTLSSGGELITTREESIEDFNYKIIRKHPDGSFDWQVNILRFQMKHNKGDTTTYFDSAHPEKEQDNVKALLFKQLTTRPFQFTLLPNGELSEIKGMDDLWLSVTDSLEPSKREALMMASKQFGNSFITDAVKNAWNFYPAKGVKKGKSWKKETRIPLFNAQVKSTYWLDEVFANELSISCTSVTKGDPDKPGELKMGPAKINYFLNGTGHGHISLDTNYGMVVSSANDLNLQGTMEVKVPMLASQAMPVTISTHVILEQL